MRLKTSPLTAYEELVAHVHCREWIMGLSRIGDVSQSISPFGMRGILRRLSTRSLPLVCAVIVCECGALSAQERLSAQYSAANVGASRISSMATWGGLTPRLYEAQLRLDQLSVSSESPVDDAQFFNPVPVRSIERLAALPSENHDREPTEVELALVA